VRESGSGKGSQGTGSKLTTVHCELLVWFKLARKVVPAHYRIFSARSRDGKERLRAAWFQSMRSWR
jgi:hypothetical protein